MTPDPVSCGVIKKFLIVGEKPGRPVSGSGPAFEKIKKIMGYPALLVLAHGTYAFLGNRSTDTITLKRLCALCQVYMIQFQ